MTLIIVLLLIINIFLYHSFLNNKIEETKVNLKTQGSIISSQINQVLPYYQSNEYSEDYIDDVLKEYSLEIGSRILVVNPSHEVLFDTFFNENQQQFIDNDEINSALNGNEMANIYEAEDQMLIYTAVPVIAQNQVTGAIFIASNADHIYTELNETMESVFIISFISVLITFLISLIFADIISEPLIKLNNGVKRIIEGDLSTELNLKENDELGQLSKSFNLMTTKLSQIEERRKKFVSNVSHELRTPMTSLKILSDTILEKEDWDQEIYVEFMKDMNSEIDRLNNIIDDLLYLVEVEKDEVNFEYELTYINYLIENAINKLQPLADRKGLRLYFVPHEKVQIYVDKNKLFRALINLINNSIKYTNEGSVRVEITTSKANVIIKVIDTGIGIPEEDIPYIFDRFYKVDKSRKRSKSSTGLGLSIVQEIIQMHEGKIFVKSEVDRGTSFNIILPKKTEL